MTNRLIVLLEVFVQVFACWTVAYHIALYSRIPAWAVIFPFMVLYVATAAYMLPHQLSVIRGMRKFRPWLVPLLLLSGSCGVLTLVISRPDDDDFSFFHRVLVQTHQMERPWILTHTSDNLGGLPAQSSLHVMTAYEPLAGALAVLFRGDALWIYQNGGSLIAGALLPLVFFLLYRQFRVPRLTAVLAALFAVTFLIVDCNTHRSFGNMAFGRLWQGKTILWTVLLPTAFLAGCRFLRRPSVYRLCIVAMTGISAVGLSNSGVYLMPVFLFAMGAAYLASYGVTRRRVKSAACLCLASFYPAMIAVALLLHWLPQPVDIRIYTDPAIWPQTWRENIALVTGGGVAIARDLIILALLPLVMLRKPLNRYPVILSLVLCLICVNPVVGPFWMKNILPASYWRLAYLFPVPWCFGLIACAAIRIGVSRAVVTVRLAGAMIVIAVTVLAFRGWLFSPGNRVTMKAVTEYKLRPWDLAFARAFHGELHNRNLLAPDDIAVVSTMVDPSITVESGRQFETLHAFRNAGNEQEGLRRAMAQNLVATGQVSPDAIAAFKQSLTNGIDAVIVHKQVRRLVERILMESPGQWEEGGNGDGYVLFIRKK